MTDGARDRTCSNTCRAAGALATGVLVIAVHAACGGSRSAEPHVAAQASSRSLTAEMKPLDLAVRVLAERAGRKWGVVSGDTFKTGDFFELFVSLNQPAYLYVIQVLPDGTAEMLFPDKGDRLLTTGREHRIPEAADEWFQVDPHDKEENLYLLMSRVPVDRASALIAPPKPPGPAAGDRRREARPHGRPKRDEAATDLGPASPRRPDRVLSITTRRVLRVKRPGGDPAVEGTAEQRDDSTLILRLHFKHA